MELPLFVFDGFTHVCVCALLCCSSFLALLFDLLCFVTCLVCFAQFKPTKPTFKKLSLHFHFQVFCALGLEQLFEIQAYLLQASLHLKSLMCEVSA